MGEMRQFRLGWEPEAGPNAREPASPPAALAPPPAIDYVAVLPWNFKKTFPPPLPEAIKEGVFGAGNVTAERVAAIHAERAGECLGMLRHIDAIEKAKAEGIDPRTGLPPRNTAAAQRLQKYFESAPVQVRKNINGLMEEYENAFGSAAAASFREAVDAWHEGIDILANPEPGTVEVRFEKKERKGGRNSVSSRPRCLKT